MSNNNTQFHGSDLETIEQLYGINPENITSFSANVNPLGISPKLRQTLSNQIDVITSYPEREYTSLRQCIASYCGIDYNTILVGNGATELISLFIQIKRPKKALLIEPTYSEYEREITLGGGYSYYYVLKEEENFLLNLTDLKKELTYDVDILIICNPNNPTSSSISNKDMRNLLDMCKQKDIFVMVDETYVEFADKMEEITSVSLTKYYNNIIILRGISKFFAAPGLRLGYAICGNKDLLNKMTQRQNPWTINSLAAICGKIMFTDYRYIEQTKQLIAIERERIYKRLSQLSSIKVYPPTANFILIRILGDEITSTQLFEAAIKKGFIIRDCSTFPSFDQHYIRFCFMSPDKNDKLLTILENTLKIKG